MKKLKFPSLQSSKLIGIAAVSLTTLFSTSAYAGDSALDIALEAQADDAKARYQYRNPKDTLEFFGIEQGMTVVEALPGGGWYSKILLPALGKEGQLIGADYAQSMWPNFSFMTPEGIEKKKTWVASWTADAEQWRSEDSAKVNAFQFDEMPESLAGTADVVLFIRALHNLSRFEDKGSYLTNAFKESFVALKPGGIVGIVQHQAAEDQPDEWANGSSGYLKKSFVKAKMEQAGFEFVSESSVNENPKDQAGEGDIVWRLPPSLNGARDDEEKKAAMEAIGESNRMTLMFRKPEKG